jgi:hypothetical protein
MLLCHEREYELSCKWKIPSTVEGIYLNCPVILNYVRFVAFMASKYTKIFLGYQLTAKLSQKQHFGDLLCLHHQGQCWE